MTTAPAAAILGDHSFDTAPPADIEADVDVGEVVVLERFALEGLVAVGDLDAHAAAGGERHHLVGGERPLGQHSEHFAAHVARGADDSDLVTHR